MEEVSRFSVKFCLTLLKDLVEEPFWSVFQKVSGSEKIFMDKREGHHSFVKIFCLTGPKRKIWQRNPSVFEKNFDIEKKLWIGGGISRFSVEVFMSHTAKEFHKRILPFLLETFWLRKVLWMKRWVTRFSVENFWSHSAEKIPGQPFNVSKTLGWWKVLRIIGGITIFRRKYFVSQCRKTS